MLWIGEMIRRLRGGKPRAAKRPRRRAVDFFAANRGGFRAGQIDRITEEWNPGAVGPNRSIVRDGARMRERARDLVDNNPLACSAVNTYAANVIERGIVLKPKFRETEQRAAVAKAWGHWGGQTAHSARECDATGQLPINELMELWLGEVIVGGGCLVHFVETPRTGRNRQRVPLTLELIPEERFATDLLTWGRNPKTANQVVAGVELDAASGRAIAYHLVPTIPNDELLPRQWGETIRLPADQCEYGFKKRRVGQVRGHTWLHAALVWVWSLSYYTDNELAASQAKSAWAYMIQTKDDPDFDFAGLFDDKPESGTVDIYGNRIEKLEPAMIFRGAPGDAIQPIGPNVPQQESLPWIQLIQRSISVALGLSYEELVRDYSKGSFSSTRAAANSDRKRFRMIQQFVVDHFCNPVYRRFFETATRYGVEGFPTPADFLANADEWLEVRWQPAGWQSVNPKEDALANDIKIKNGTKSRARVIADESGGDWEEEFEQMATERRRQEELSLIFESDAEEQQNITEERREEGREESDEFEESASGEPMGEEDIE